MFRALVLIKQSFREMFMLVHPQAVAPLKIAGQVVPNRVVYSVLAFIFLYFMTIVVLTFALLISGLDFVSAFTAVDRLRSTTPARASASSARQPTMPRSTTSRPGSARWRCSSAASRSSPSWCCSRRRSGANSPLQPWM